MTVYEGGSDKDEILISVTGNSGGQSLGGQSLGNQISIIFTKDVNEVGKGFTAKISFGKTGSPHFVRFTL